MFDLGVGVWVHKTTWRQTKKKIHYGAFFCHINGHGTVHK